MTGQEGRIEDKTLEEVLKLDAAATHVLKYEQYWTIGWSVTCAYLFRL